MNKHRKRRGLMSMLNPFLVVVLLLTSCGLVVTGATQQEAPVASATSAATASEIASHTASPDVTHQSEATPSLQSSPKAEADAIKAPATPKATAAQTHEAAVDDVPVHMSAPAADMEVDIQPMDGSTFELDPPPNGFGHWLSNYGKAGSGASNTVYVIGHSCYGVGCTATAFPFNHLSEPGYIAGDRITLTTAKGSTIHYRVTNMCRYDKHSTPAQKCGTWDKVPGRLVLISCYTEDPLGTNVVVFATIEK